MFKAIPDPRAIRRELGQNQQAFWSRIGVTQSGGSRYESGRNMPKPTRELLRLIHIEQIDLAKIKHEDFEIVEYLKETHPDLHKSLKRAVHERNHCEDILNMVCHLKRAVHERNQAQAQEAA